jgi:hypothetical protein
MSAAAPAAVPTPRACCICGKELAHPTDEQVIRDRGGRSNAVRCSQLDYEGCMYRANKLRMAQESAAKEASCS